MRRTRIVARLSLPLPVTTVPPYLIRCSAFSGWRTGRIGSGSHTPRHDCMQDRSLTGEKKLGRMPSRLAMQRVSCSGLVDAHAWQQALPSWYAAVKIIPQCTSQRGWGVSGVALYSALVVMFGVGEGARKKWHGFAVYRLNRSDAYTLKGFSSLHLR